MIEKIYHDEILTTLTVGTIEEEGIEVEVGDSLLLRNGDLDSESAAILKPDAYYSTRRMAQPPKAIDNFMVVKDDDGYHFYLIELKSSGRVRHISRKDIIEKFSTVVNSFIKTEYAHIFMVDVNVKSFCLWLVCDPFGMKGKDVDEEKYRKKIGSCGLDAFASMKPFSLNGIVSVIEPMLPPPIIQKTHYINAHS